MKGDWLSKFRKTRSLAFTDESYRRCRMAVEKILPLYKKHLRKGSKLLDLGFGPGCTGIPLSHHFQVVGLDKDERIIDYALENARKFGGKIEFKKGDIRHLDKLFAKDSFDAVTSAGVMEHFPEEDIKKLVEKQLRIAPVVFIHVPTGNDGKVVDEDGIEKNLWTVEYWLNHILKDFKIVEHQTIKPNQKMPRFIELNIVLKRG
ncbi:MAG: class I SAM-dependent methyltransferase [Candidatus Altiarchaeota archaeon]